MSQIFPEPPFAAVQDPPEFALFSAVSMPFIVLRRRTFEACSTGGKPTTMAPFGHSARRYSRRQILTQLATTPLLLKSAPLLGSDFLRLPDPEPDFGWHEARYVPQYQSPSPLADVLRLVTPGLDDFPTENYAYQISALLDIWKQAFQSGDFNTMQPCFTASARAGQLIPSRVTRLRGGYGVESVRCEIDPTAPLDHMEFLHHLPLWLGPGVQVDHAEFELTTITKTGASPLTARTIVRFSFVLHTATQREQRIGTWQIDLQQKDRSGWLVAHLQPLTESRCTLQGRGFEDVTENVLGGIPSYADQMMRSLDHWRTVIDGASGIDVYGNNGVAAGDYDNDGFDDLYVSQPAGLPNRLYHNRGDGTFEDMTERAGVGVLDNTACALFADFRNIGLQDLLVVCGSGPLLFQNLGDGTFRLKNNAFRFAQPPQGTFTHAAVADYDRDGHLDVYFCLYSYYLGLDQYHYPTPYFDARNGPPNFLMHNQGDGTFIDHTAVAGLSVENDRYSFACAWGDTAGGKSPDLYVVNDFGRNNLYCGNGDGTFRAVSQQSHVQDVGAGMSACWADINNDGKPDLYVSNMWSAAGQRVAQQQNFHSASTAPIRDLYRHHARGNSLYRNDGGGTFTNASTTAQVEAGRWAWGSDAWDFDHDGFQDIYVTNGYITAPQALGAQNAASRIDLGSFFWRQVVAKSPDDSEPSLAYEHGWNALNELIRIDNSWSGNERNVLFANNGDGTFSDISGAMSMDFLEDGRAFALADLDHDGRLEVIIKSRNAPQLRIVRNAMEHLGDGIALRLRGTRSNRDAIGTVVELQSGDLRQTKGLQAGTGFLSQHSKEIFFGLGKVDTSVTATVHWPSGLVQQFQHLPHNHRIDLIEGTLTFIARPFAVPSPAYVKPAASIASPQALPKDFGTWLLEPLKAPAFTLPSRNSTFITLDSTRGNPVLLHLWSGADPGHAEHLSTLERGRPTLVAARVTVLAINIDDAETQAATQLSQLSFAILFATSDIAGVYNLIFRYLFDRRSDLPLPTSFLLDPAGMVVKVYQGALTPQQIARDVASIPATREERMRLALPFPGTLHQDAFTRNDFTYGVAMFQHGYLDQAAESFEQVIARRPNDAEAQYNLGTLSLRRNDFAMAKQYLERALQLKPDYPEAWNNLGMMAAQQGRTAEAIQSFKQSVQLRPTYATAFLNLGNLYRHERQFSLAQDCLDRALALQPDDPEANYSLGMLHAQQDQLPQAQQFLQKSIDLRPAYPEALTNLAVLFVRQQNYSRAEDLFTTCIRMSRNFEGAYLNLANLYLLQQDRSKARAVLQNLLRLHPQSSNANQALHSLDATP